MMKFNYNFYLMQETMIYTGKIKINNRKKNLYIQIIKTMKNYTIKK